MITICSVLKKNTVSPGIIRASRIVTTIVMAVNRKAIPFHTEARNMLAKTIIWTCRDTGL